jgi:heme-degrading monooxygenase HmoA
MIARVWHGYAADRSAAERYVAHFRSNVVPELESLPGYRGAQLATRDTGAEIEFLALTRWESMEAVRAFAGDCPERAVVEPEARAALSRFDEHVTHYEIVVDAGRT